MPAHALRRRAAAHTRSGYLVEPIERRLLLSANVSGTVYNDLQANGAVQSVPFVVPGVRVYVDLNNNGKFDAGEPTALTGADGNYVITGIAANSYTLRIVVPSGWMPTAPASAANNFLVMDGWNLGGENFGLFQYGAVSGDVYNDLNGDTVRQIGEQGLQGWTVFIDTNGNGMFDAGEPSAVTDSTGHYSIGNLTLGQYKLGVVSQSGWLSLLPETTVSVSSSGATLLADWPETQNGVISGTVYSDANGNGALDSGEWGLGGWTVYADLNNNGQLDAGEPSTVSLPSGAYHLGGLQSGQYIVREVNPRGTTESQPSSPYLWTVFLFNVQDMSGYNFGNQVPATAALSGLVFQDFNSNGVMDTSTDYPIANATVFIDLNNNGVLDSGEPSMATGNASGSYGFYEFKNLPAPATYAVRVVPASVNAHSVATGITPKLVSVTPGLLTISNNLGVRDLTTVMDYGGYVFDDSNANGVQDSAESNLPYWTVYLDLNNNGQLDANEPWVTTNYNGYFDIPVYTPGTYHLRQLLPAGWGQTTPVAGDGSVIWNAQYGIGLITSDVFGAAKTGVVAGIVYSDTNDDGVHQPTESGLAGVTVYADRNNNGILDAGEPTATTSSSGNYSLSNVVPGTAVIREVVPAGYAQTAPAGGSASVSLTEGQSVSGPSFGNVPFSSSLRNSITLDNNVHQLTLRRNPDGQHVDFTVDTSVPVFDVAIDDPAGLSLAGGTSTDTINLDYTNGDPLPATLRLSGLFTLGGLRFGTSSAPADPLSGHLINLGQSTLWIAYGAGASPLAAIQQLLRNGYANGAWSGTSDAITTSAAGAGLAIGYADSSDGSGVNSTLDTIELKTTRAGDTNLDGSVNLPDLLTLTRSFGKGTTWDQGDFNYDASVNLSDFLALTRNFGKTLVVNPLIVTSTADDGSLGTLRYAIAHSNPGDTITLDPRVFPPGTSHTITLNGSQLEIVHNLTISGPGSANLSISGNNTSRVFQIDSGVSASISGLTITSGNAGSAYGGGINNAGTLNLSTSVITASTAKDGGGLYSISGTANLTGCTFSNDTASAFGGGLFNDSGSTSTVTGCTFVSNTSPNGGAMVDYGTALNLINDTITQNIATAGPGGGINNIAGALSVSDCTIVSNTSSGSGAGIHVLSGTGSINNSIVAEDSITNSTTPSDLSGSFAGSNNLIGDGSGGLSTANHNLLGSTSSLLNPTLGSLSNNGGPTLTMMPLSGSPVIDAGSNALIPMGITTDQRGYARIFNGTVDIGAAEFGASLSPTLTSATAQQTVPSTARRRA